MAGASLNDLSRAGFRQGSRVSSIDIAAAADGSGKASRTDIGTLVIHWTVTIACIITLVTGLRLASDQEFSLVWRAIAPVLPQGEIWSWHIISGLALYFASTAYAVYMFRSGLKRRVALAKVRALTMPVPRKTKWGAVNVLLHWALYGLLLIQTVTGFLLYLGHGGWWVTIHSFTATAVLIYIVAHSISHFGYGGLQQLLRLFRPSPLVPTKATRSRPFLIAASVGSVVAASLVLADYGTLDALQIRAIEAREAPKLDGVMDEAMWKTARPVYVRTMQGSGLGGLGESTVEIRAVHDDRKVHFAFRWEDPSRSLRRIPMIKKEDGWHVVGNRVDNADVTDFYEDKFAILFAKNDGFGNAGTTHMGKTPLSDRKLPAAMQRARPALHHRRQLRRRVAVEGLARRRPRRRRRPVLRPAPRRDAGRGLGQGALPGRLLERSRPRLLQLQLQDRRRPPRAGAAALAPAEGPWRDRRGARPVRPRPGEQRHGGRRAGG